jgi:signal transduction histidine kinase
MTPRPVAARDGRAAHSTDERLLDAFAARAAHAVGAGVSIAGGYAALLRERCADEIGDEGQAALAGVERGVGRLRLFVDDLLELAALDAAPMRREPLRAAGAARAAVDGLAEALEAASVEVEVGTLPDLVADASLLERLFHHLLRSSLGAIGDGPGRIEISGVRRAAGARIEVADDGPALDPRGAATLFEPFAMPRGSAPTAGAGVSMAIARRIAERHGGSAWAHTGRRDGCTIVVLLPEAM